MNLLENVKAAVTVRQAAERYGLEVNRGNMVCCPFHNDRTPSMKLNEDYFYCFGFVPELSRKIYAGADMFLMPSKSEPCGLSQMIALRYGTVPIVRETGGLKDSISDSGDGKGNGFTFQTYDSQDMLGAVRRAIAGYWNEEGGWKVLMKRAMECDNSWGKSANEYIRLYRAMLKE